MVSEEVKIWRNNYVNDSDSIVLESNNNQTKLILFLL